MDMIEHAKQIYAISSGDYSDKVAYIHAYLEHNFIQKLKKLELVGGRRYKTKDNGMCIYLGEDPEGNYIFWHYNKINTALTHPKYRFMTPMTDAPGYEIVDYWENE